MKDKILHKAADLFLSFGFKSVTMDEIANELGISKKTIYSHFSNKRKLVRDTTMFVFNKINTGICQICSGEQDPVTELFEIKNLVTEQLKGEKHPTGYQLQKYYPMIFDELKEKQFESINICITANLKRGIELGVYRKEIDIDLISKFYLNGNMGLMNIEQFPPEKYPTRALKAAYLEYHIRAIATPKGLKILEKIVQK